MKRISDSWVDSSPGFTGSSISARRWMGRLGPRVSMLKRSSDFWISMSC